MKTFALPLALVAAFAIAACSSKTTTPTPAAPTPEEMLSSSSGKAWVYTSIVDANGDQGYPFTDSCENDNQQVFFSDKHIELDAGALKCGTQDLQREPNGNWSFSGDHKLLIIVDPTKDTTVFTVNTLTATSMKLTTNKYTPANTFTFRAK